MKFHLIEHHLVERIQVEPATRTIKLVAVSLLPTTASRENTAATDCLRYEVII